MKLLEITQQYYYHGSVDKIENFSGVAYFTPWEDAATGYARGKINKGGHAFLYKVRLKFKNPFICHTMQQIGSLTAVDVKRLSDAGYDAAVYDGSGKEPIPETVPFSPETQVEIVSHRIISK